MFMIKHGNIIEQRWTMLMVTAHINLIYLQPTCNSSRDSVRVADMSTCYVEETLPWEVDYSPHLLHRLWNGMQKINFVAPEAYHLMSTRMMEKSDVKSEFSDHENLPLDIHIRYHSLCILAYSSLCTSLREGHGKWLPPGGTREVT